MTWHDMTWHDMTWHRYVHDIDFKKKKKKHCIDTYIALHYIASHHNTLHCTALHYIQREREREGVIVSCLSLDGCFLRLLCRGAWGVGRWRPLSLVCSELLGHIKSSQWHVRLDVVPSTGFPMSYAFFLGHIPRSVISSDMAQYSINIYICIHRLYTCQSGLERWRHRFVADGSASEHIAKEPLACCSLASDASATFQALQNGIKNQYQAQSISGLLQPIGEWWLGEKISHVTLLFAHFTSLCLGYWEQPCTQWILQRHYCGHQATQDA